MIDIHAPHGLLELGAVLFEADALLVEVIGLVH
jgi:hypothetical protein